MHKSSKSRRIIRRRLIFKDRTKIFNCLFLPRSLSPSFNSFGLDSISFHSSSFPIQPIKLSCRAEKKFYASFTSTVKCLSFLLLTSLSVYFSYVSDICLCISSTSTFVLNCYIDINYKMSLFPFIYITACV